MEFVKLLEEQLSANAAGGAAPPREFVLSFANGFEDKRWEYARFQDFIWDNIGLTALTKRERDALGDRHESALRQAAKNLRLTDADDIGKGSELAEAFLYGVMEHHFKALPVVPKIFHKQNVQDNAKGADSVHITVPTDGEDFLLWYGEAKFFNSIEDARLASVIESVGNSLESEKLRKENSMICGMNDLEDHIGAGVLLDKIRAEISSRVSIDSLKPRLNVPILLLHECEVTKKEVVWNDLYVENLIKYHRGRSRSYFNKQLATLGSKVNLYADITFHVILFPVPDKGAVVERFIKKVGAHKEVG